ncbi:MAG: F0F1 ATP synthase subunit A [Candidatus Eremiobacteraeota bacterium]|nr:F0F1 ATP synthase subunit A [Candidatus Eremiobacteraeota bacterium]
MKQEIGAHSTWTLPLVGTVHADTILTTWVAMVVALAFLAWVGNSYRSPLATKRQTIFEGVINFIADLVYGAIGRSGEAFVPFFIAVFLFIFVLNQFDILPLRPLGLPLGGSPTADLNTIVPLTLCVYVLIFGAVIARRRVGHYLHHFTQPFWPLIPLNILDEVSRVLTLTARLFFNILVGEILFIIVTIIITGNIKIGALNVSLWAVVLPFFIQFFNFFVGTVQAFVFTLLGIVYLSLALGEEH